MKHAILIGAAALAISAAATAQPTAVERARTLLASGDAAGAVELLKTAASVTPADPAIHNMLGAILNREGRYREALIHASEAVRLNPDDPRYRYNRGIVLSEHGRFDEALLDFNFAIGKMPEQAQMHLERGAALLALDRGAAARADWASARRLDGNLIWTDFYEAVHDLVDGDAAAAIPKLSAVAKAQPDFASAQLWLLVSHQLTGSSFTPRSVQDEWVRHLLAFHHGTLPFDQLLRIARADKVTGDARRTGEAWLHHGLKLQRVGRVADAKSAFKKAIATPAPRHAWKLLAVRQLGKQPPR